MTHACFADTDDWIIWDAVAGVFVLYTPTGGRHPLRGCPWCGAALPGPPLVEEP